MSKLLIKPRYLVDEKGKKESVVLSLEDYESLLEMLADSDDWHAYDEAVEENKSFRKLEDVKRDLRKDGLLK